MTISEEKLKEIANEVKLLGGNKKNHNCESE